MISPGFSCNLLVPVDPDDELPLGFADDELPLGFADDELPLGYDELSFLSSSFSSLSDSFI